MTFSTFIGRTWLLAYGDNVAPKPNTMSFKKVLNLANTYIDQWVDEPGVNWNSLYVRQQLTPLVTATDTFSLHANIRKISQQEGDYVVITRTTGTQDFYTVIPPDQLQEHSDANAAAQIGRNLVFASAFTSTSAQLSGTIKVPAYSVVTALADEDSTIPVDNPEWLIFTTAAELIKADPEKADKVKQLIDLADKAMDRMKLENRAQPATDLKEK